MDEVARSSAEERRLYFEEAAARFGRLSPQLIEKDFWVCWTLRRLFELDELREHLTFKGGTSLSKVYRVIERFSEDIDLSIERAYLGFDGANDPEAPQLSGKAREKRIDGLQEACKAMIRDRLFPALDVLIKGQLSSTVKWNLHLDTDGQTIQFEYPPAVVGAMTGYFASGVCIELGARSDHFPVEQAELQPYLAEIIPSACSDARVMVRVLQAQRTFWEKATILHAIVHEPIEKGLSPRQSRHLYDLAKLADHVTGREAIHQTDLLLRVATHKSVFFKSPKARYDLAKPGTLRLIPSDMRLAELQQDYNAMRPMFFSDPPSFESLVERLRRLEAEINDGFSSLG